MNRGRPIGKRLRQACEIVEAIGPCGSGKVWPLMDGVTSDNAGKYCARAVAHGLMVYQDGTPRLFSVVPNWRALIDRPKVEKPKPVARTYAPHALHSIWNGAPSMFKQEAA